MTAIVSGAGERSGGNGFAEGGGGARRQVWRVFAPRGRSPDPAMRVLREPPADVLRALADILRRHVQCVEIRGGF